MHLSAVLPGVLARLLYRHAKSFACMSGPPGYRASDWPDAFQTGRRTRWAVSTLTILLLLLVAQIHFVRRFNVEGHVYIYPKAFGYTAAGYRAMPGVDSSPDPHDPPCTRPPSAVLPWCHPNLARILAIGRTTGIMPTNMATGSRSRIASKGGDRELFSDPPADWDYRAFRRATEASAEPEARER
jgi:hypothetical protein